MVKLPLKKSRKYEADVSVRITVELRGESQEDAREGAVEMFWEKICAGMKQKVLPEAKVVLRRIE